MSTTNPHAGSPLAVFVTQRILELRPRKQQRDIAAEAGFINFNMLSMIKSGATKLALDRVPALARALDCDPARLFLLAVDQPGNETARDAIREIFGTIVTRNEVVWLEEIRDASDRKDPTLTLRLRSALRGIFGK